MKGRKAGIADIVITFLVKVFVRDTHMTTSKCYREFMVELTRHFRSLAFSFYFLIIVYFRVSLFYGLTRVEGRGRGRGGEEGGGIGRDGGSQGSCGWRTENMGEGEEVGPGERGGV